MATEVRFRRGTTAQHAAFTGALAEITVDTDKKTAVVHDGATPGGFPLALKADVNVTMATAVYDPQEIADDAFDRENHTGQQAIATITGLAAALAEKVSVAIQAFTPAQQAQARANIGAALRGQLYGLTLANNAADATNDIDVSPGEAASDDNTPVLMVLTSVMTKRLDAAWVAGSGNGGLDTGAVGNNTYHLFLIYNPTSGAVDALFSLSPTAPTMPAGFTAKRRIGSIYRLAGANVAFVQIGDFFYRAAVVQERNSVTAVSNTLLPLTVPSGIKVRPMLAGLLISTGTGSFGFMQLANGDMPTTLVEIVRTNSGADVTSGVVTEFFTNTAAQIRFSQGFVGSNVSSATLSSIGWIDDRGKS